MRVVFMRASRSVKGVRRASTSGEVSTTRSSAVPPRDNRAFAVHRALEHGVKISEWVSCVHAGAKGEGGGRGGRTPGVYLVSLSYQTIDDVSSRRQNTAVNESNANGQCQSHTLPEAAQQDSVAFALLYDPFSIPSAVSSSFQEISSSPGTAATFSERRSLVSCTYMRVQ